MTGLRYSPLHVTEFCGEMQGKFKVGLARLIILRAEPELKFANYESVQRRLQFSGIKKGAKISYRRHFKNPNGTQRREDHGTTTIRRDDNLKLIL